MGSITAARDGIARRGTQWLLVTGLLGWFSMVGIDFFLHGGLMAAFWVDGSPFLLPPTQAFALIPVGYAAFMLLAALLLWLMVQLEVVGWQQGLLFGLKLGALMWGALTLALLSATTAELDLLLGWFLGQTVELAVGGAVIGSALAGARRSRLFVIVLLMSLLLAAVTIVLQSLELAPAVRI